MSNFWNDDRENENGFRDGPENGEAEVTPQMSTPRKAQAPTVQEVEDLVEEVAQEDEDDYESILADANLRIEQGTLYKMIMNSDLFSEMDVDQRATDNVQREIRKFAKERMEIMLGMRQEVAKESVVSSPFNDLEVTILKKLASAASKGATESKEVQVRASAPVAPPKKNTLTPIGPRQTAPKQVAPVKKSQPLAQKQPIKRQQRPPATIEEAIKADDGYSPIGKTIGEMSEDEIIQRNKDSASRQALYKAAKSSTALPPPSVDQMNMMNQMRATDMVSDPGLANLVNMVKARA